MIEQQAAISIDTPEALAHFAMCQCIGRLKIETGPAKLGFKQSTLKIVQQQYGIKARTKKAALAELEDLYEATYGRRYGSKGEGH